MIVSKVATQSNQVATPKQGVTFTDEPASQAPRPVTSAPVQQAKSTTTTQTANASTSANAKQQYVIPQKSTPSNTPAPDQQAVGQIAQNKNLTLNRDTNQSVSLNANGQRVLTVSGVDNVVQKNGQTTVYSYNNGQVHQFDKNLNMTSGPSDHTVLQNDGKNVIYISDGKPYQAQSYPESYTRVMKTVNGIVLQKIPTRTVNTFTQDGKTNRIFPGKGTSENVSSYKVNNDESVTITLADGKQETLQNNWVKPVSTTVSSNANVEDKTDDARNELLTQPVKASANQNNGTVLENGAGYQVVQKGSSISVNYNSKQVVAYNNVTNLKKDVNGLTFNANNGGLYITLGKPQSNSLGSHLPFNQSETEQALLNDTKKNSNILYLGRNNTAFSPLEDTRYFQTIEKRGNQYYYMQQGTGVGGAFTGNKGAGVDNGGEAEAEITNVKFAPNGDVTFTEVHGGKTMTLTNNWLKLNNTSNSNKPASNTSSPNSKNNTSASTANKGSQAKGSQSKGSASVAGQSQGKASATPGQSREPASNPNDVQHGGNTPASAAKGSTSANKPAASVGNKASQAKGSQAGGHTASAGKGSVSASASAGKTSATPTNKTSQGSAAVKGSVSASKTSTSAGKTQAQSQSANGSAAKGSVSINQSSAASQSGKGNQWQSQGQHVNVIKHPAKVVKASAPVAQLAAKRVASAPAEETTAQASVPVETAAPAAKAATPSAVQSSSSSSNSMPNTGINSEVAAELGMVGAGLVLGLIAKRKSKEK